MGYLIQHHIYLAVLLARKEERYLAAQHKQIVSARVGMEVDRVRVPAITENLWN